MFSCLIYGNKECEWILSIFHSSLDKNEFRGVWYTRINNENKNCVSIPIS